MWTTKTSELHIKKQGIKIKLGLKKKIKGHQTKGTHEVRAGPTGQQKVLKTWIHAPVQNPDGCPHKF